MHDFTLIRTRNALQSLLLALGSVGLLACPMDEEDTGATTTAPDATTSDTDDAATSTSDDTSTSNPDDTSTSNPDDTSTSNPDDTSTSNPDDTSTSESSSTTGAATYTLSGTVGRTVDFAPENDGVGTLFVAAFADCGLGQSLLGVAVVPGADLSAADARVAFSLPGLPAGPVHLGLFLDDNGDADPMGPLPHDGDLVYGFDACDGELDCVALEIADADLVDVALDLNLLEVDECP